MKDLYWHYKESLPLKFCNEVINFAKTQQSSFWTHQLITANHIRLPVGNK